MSHDGSTAADRARAIRPSPVRTIDRNAYVSPRKRFSPTFGGHAFSLIHRDIPRLVHMSLHLESFRLPRAPRGALQRRLRAASPTRAGPRHRRTQRRGRRWRIRAPRRPRSCAQKTSLRRVVHRRRGSWLSDAHERIGEFWGHPESRAFAGLLIDAEEDRTRGRCWSGCSARPTARDLSLPAERCTSCAG
jgi:hypothetical protein